MTWLENELYYWPIDTPTIHGHSYKPCMRVQCRKRTFTAFLQPVEAMSGTRQGAKHAA
jgi:hypothetical protein